MMKRYFISFLFINLEFCQILAASFTYIYMQCGSSTTYFSMTLPNTGKKSLTSFQAGRTIDIHNDSLLYFIEILKFRKRENISFKMANLISIIENPRKIRKIFLNQLATTICFDFCYGFVNRVNQSNSSNCSISDSKPI